MHTTEQILYETHCKIAKYHSNKVLSLIIDSLQGYFASYIRLSIFFDFIKII